MSSKPVTENPSPETPGVDMPGRFPIPKQGAPGPASDAFQTAKEYAQTAVQSAGGKVGEYLPTSVSSYLSSEPAVLSDEPQTVPSSIIAKPSPILTTTNNNPTPLPHSDPHTGYIPGTLQDDTSLAKLPEERRLEGLPSHDDDTGGPLGKSGGVGALPGSAGESSVALLPDERKEQQEEAYTGASADASIRTLPGSGYAPSPLGQSHFVPQTTGRDHAFSRDEEKVFGSNANKDLDVPAAVDATKKTTYTAGQDTHAVGAGSGGLAGAGGGVESESPKKSGFMHKVKGEMKVLSGKMSHNESKIEEGRKMMGKN